MRWFELIFLFLCGILFFYLGWQIWKKEKINLIHDYHYKKVKDIDKKAYTGQIGKAMLVIGAGIILTGIVDFITSSLYGWCFFGICFSIGLVVMIHAQIKYNHGIF
ncbi:Domain of uncharacterised function (DUF3784) [uncultured Roseburia sp.]|uniref:DUF3784 domain-containing protein n=1 Tax=Brotonthovivens ammoniilytica TaxID=2981725 RepID=A0ABT2TJV8_9FIRM|nr:DUF3784 domain-containing protein [Brotonthovivens ammoniilytica]MCU6762490.1 DUF3784 domain-containing protein [Brotonthovivens ammoniilytica]SCI73621.1 Domain of uncharacterised function (DUF3784) [uncultured Roseburia sp.]